MRKFLLPGIDLLWVGTTPFLALALRENFDSTAKSVAAIEPYAGISIIVAAFVFGIAGLNRDIWSFASLQAVMRIAAAATIAILLSLAATFVLNRLDGVARSLPIIQWLLLVAGMMGTRVAARLLRRHIRNGAAARTRHEPQVEHVLVVGVNHVTELYLQSIAEFAAGKISVMGILAPEDLRGRLVQFHKIIGPPEEIMQILAQFSVHGITISRIVVTQPMEQLSDRGREMLQKAERAAGVPLDFFAERLGIIPPYQDTGTTGGPSAGGWQSGMAATDAEPARNAHLARYGNLKRTVDLVSAIVLMVVLSPLLLLVSVLVMADVGLPLTFWQQRPGRHGRPFKLYKFRTMGAAHDREGNRIPDERRLSAIGRFLRKSRLDELPQLYNVAKGQMSLVGPRPLLPKDLAPDATMRLSVRPGVTGWAQINGGREVTVDDKDALDRWYVQNMSLLLDLKILLRTLVFLLKGERVNGSAVRAAREQALLAVAASDPGRPLSKLNEVDTRAA